MSDLYPDKDPWEAYELLCKRNENLAVENATLRGDLDSVRGHPSATFCGICERPLERCECDKTIMDLKAELSAIRNSVRQKSVRATEQQLREVTAELEGLRKDRKRLEWFASYAFSLTGDLWPQNETTQALYKLVFYRGLMDFRKAIDEAMTQGGGG